MQDFSKKLDYIVNNMQTLPYGEIVEFSKTVKQKLKQEQQKLESQIEINKANYLKFTQLFFEPNVIKKPEVTHVTKQLGGVNITMPIINNIYDTKKYPDTPCAFKEVNEWSFIYFKQLKQILPVRNTFQILTPVQEKTCTKIHYCLFKDLAIEQLNDSYAIIPFTRDTWSKFNKIPINKWEIYLNQLNILPINLSYKFSQKIPIYTTTGLVDIAKTLKPEDMAVQWSLFVQLYMLLYIFKHAGDTNHFTCN